MTQQQAGPRAGWGAAAGHVDLPGASEPPTHSGAALDRQLVMERVHRYGWGCDELREEWIKDCFTPDATWSGTVMGVEQVGPIEGGAQIAAFLAQFFPQMEDQRRHLFINTVVEEQTATTALAYANVLITGAMNAQVQVRSTGFYRLRLVKVGRSWLIYDLFAGFDSPW